VSTENGYTPLHAAFSYGYIELIEFLLSTIVLHTPGEEKEEEVRAGETIQEEELGEEGKPEEAAAPTAVAAGGGACQKCRWTLKQRCRSTGVSRRRRLKKLQETTEWAKRVVIFFKLNKFYNKN